MTGPGVRIGALAAGVLLAGCSGGEPLPAGPGLLRRSSQAMARVRSISFRLEVQGDLGLLLIRRAEGSMTREGEATGTVQLEQGQSLVEYQVVISGGTYFLKGPTGGWSTIPRGLASGIPDPTILLDPDRGLVAVLSGVREAQTEETTDVGGVAAYRVRGQLPADPLRPFIPLPPDVTFVDGTLWIGRDEPVLLRAEIQPPPAPGQSYAPTLVIGLGSFNAPVSVTPPA